MARPLRLDFPGAWHHVMNRGLGKRNIFLNDQDRQSFLDLLGETSETFRIEMHAYSLMDNHYHLLVHTPAGGLSRAMRHLNGVYTQKWNRAHRSDGPLFRGRYKALLVDKEEYLLELIRYIHLNPVEAGLSNHPKEHRWTSHGAYLKRGRQLSWLKTDEILSRFGSGNKALRKMNEFVCEGVPELFKETLAKQKVVLGGSGFREWVARNFRPHKKNPMTEIPKRDQKIKGHVSVNHLLDRICFANGISLKELRRKQSGKKNDVKSIAVYLARRLTGLSQKDLGRWFNTPNPYAIAKIQQRFRERLERDRTLKKKTAELVHLILSTVKT